MSEFSNTYVIDVLRTQEDEHTREQAGLFAGSVLLHGLVETEPITEPETILDKLYQAEAGDKEAFLAVGANVHTELVEWKYKNKNIVPIRMQRDENGHLFQHGHKMRDVHANTFLQRKDSIVLQRRAPIELVNSFRIEQEVSTGRLQDYWFVTASLVPEMLSADAADKEAFFGDTMSAALQATTADAFGVLTESAFVSGVDTRDGERFDISTIKKMYAYFGVDVGNYSTEEILARPLLISKKLMPQGVSDFVKLYDTFAGGQRFFGVLGETGDYDTFLDFCYTRERELDSLAELISERLIREKDTFVNPVDVVMRISKLAKHYLVERSRFDRSIDPRIFGAEAALYIETMRHYEDTGRTELADNALKNAHKTAKGGACLTYSGAEVPNDGDDDWSGGEKKKFSKCKSCKSYVYEVGACDACESCVQRPWIMQKAWDEFQKEKKKQKAKKPVSTEMKASNEQFILAS